MSVFKRLVAVYMLLVAVAVAAHFLVTQFYDPMLEDTALTVWRVLDPLMVIGVAAALIAAFARKRALGAGTDEQPVSREYLSANAMFFYSAALLIALLYNWFGVEFADPSNDVPLVWIWINTTFPILLAASGVPAAARVERAEHKVEQHSKGNKTENNGERLSERFHGDPSSYDPDGGDAVRNQRPIDSTRPQATSIGPTRCLGSATNSATAVLVRLRLRT